MPKTSDTDKLIQLKNKDIPELRKQILEEQDGVCFLCNEVPDTPCLDHHHKKRIKGTSRIRGVLCLRCNTFLGKVENNAFRYKITFKILPCILRKMAEYLEKEQYLFIHPSEAPKKKQLNESNFNKLKKLYKIKYPKRKELTFPKNRCMTKKLTELYKEFNITPKFLSKNKKNIRKGK